MWNHFPLVLITHLFERVYGFEMIKTDPQIILIDELEAVNRPPLFISCSYPHWRTVMNSRVCLELRVMHHDDKDFVTFAEVCYNNEVGNLSTDDVIFGPQLTLGFENRYSLLKEDIKILKVIM